MTENRSAVAWGEARMRGRDNKGDVDTFGGDACVQYYFALW